MAKEGKRTKCVHSGTIFDENVRGVNTPIYTSTSFGYLDSDKLIYPRLFNTPNQEALIAKLCALENGEAGLVFSSGMAAISTTIFSFLKNGDHVVFQPGLYGGTYHFVKTKLRDFNIDFTISESNKIDDFVSAVKLNTKVLYIESPSNPLLSITDISSVARFAKSRNIVSMVDNTFASPINQNPLNLGIDVVLHSATKYLGGHSDICAGAVVSSHKNVDTIRGMATSLGGSLDANTCYLLERSIKTLALRVEQQNMNAMEISKFLETHAKINRVYYPGLKTHPGYEIAKNQMSGFGGMLSFELKGPDGDSFQKKLKLIRPSLSLGGIESIICAPAITSHRNIPKPEREKIGISDRLLRLSVGIEDQYDLIADLDQALASI